MKNTSIRFSRRPLIGGAMASLASAALSACSKPDAAAATVSAAKDF